MNFIGLNISDINTPTSIIQLGCYGVASLFIGRKVTQFLISGTCLAGSKVADYMNRKDLSESFQKNGREYFDSAKKNLARDLTFAAGLSAAGFGIGSVFNSTELNCGSNIPDGQTTCAWPNGPKYVGEYRNGKANGQGEMTWPNGAKYVGEYRNGKANGQGEMTWLNGEKYVGQFENDKKNGPATYTWPTGAKYVGQYENDQINGPGVFTSADGKTCNELYVVGKRISRDCSTN